MERDEPDRYLNKAEAVRRLIHAAVRMYAAGEDPFAVHLLIQSADKLLIDIAKKRGIDLAFDWEKWIKKEHRTEFFEMYRETYNFLKHADRDAGQLAVHNIAEVNASQLTMVIENYAAVFDTTTEHMIVFRWFARLWKPDWFLRRIEELFPPKKAREISKSWSVLRAEGPQEFFKAAFSNGSWNTPALERERNSDFADNAEFYSRRFQDMD